MRKILSLIGLVSISVGLAFAQTGDYNPNPSNSACINIYNNFGLRATDSSTNFEVSKLQDFLQEKGLLNSDPTGYFGRLTESAVKSYQSSRGIVSTGYVGQLTRAKIQSETCGANPGPVMCTMEIRYCPNGSPMPRDADCTWRSDKCSGGPVACTMEAKMCPDGSTVGRTGPNCEFAACPYSVNLTDYTIDFQMYSYNLTKYLTLNSSGYYDATGVDGMTSIAVIPSNSSAQCTTEHRSQYGSYSFISYEKYIIQNYDKNGIGLDYYRVTCGDGVTTKKIVKEFIVETKSSYYSQGPIACTMEAKMCPDGSTVGRTGPNCEFAACPSNSNLPIMCTADYRYCPNGSPMPRDADCTWRSDKCYSYFY